MCLAKFNQGAESGFLRCCFAREPRPSIQPLQEKQFVRWIRVTTPVHRIARLPPLSPDEDSRWPRRPPVDLQFVSRRLLVTSFLLTPLWHFGQPLRAFAFEFGSLTTSMKSISGVIEASCGPSADARGIRDETA